MTAPTIESAGERTRPGDVRGDKTQWKLGRGAMMRENGVLFRVWAPAARTVTLHLATGAGQGEYPLQASGERGTYELFVPDAAAGDRYGFRVDGGELTPDPVSRSQPDGVHALSEIVDSGAFDWTDQRWSGLSLADFVIYELHVGTFTPEGTFAAAIARLPELQVMGVTAVELLPVASFPGRRNWGYDGVHLYAPQASYGGPDGLKQLVNAAHGHGIAVVLDVVYNHVGPEGNYLDRFGPYFTETYRTPWGRAVNYDGPGSDGVRRWAHDNALYWICEFHIDALRLDAVQGIFDFGALSFLEELSDEVHELGRQLHRKVQLLAESDLNDPRLLQPPEQGGYGIDAQWADDVHHTIHATLTGERHGYYQDFQGIATIADVYREPFFYARRYAPHRDRTHGRSSAGVPRQRFIVAAQNHDQIGNRPDGERLAGLVPPDRQRLAAALVLLSPYVPLLFMGEEYGETAPFLYFVDHGDPALVESVREGRKREFLAIGKLEAQIDPQAEETFARSRLDWSRRESGHGAALLSLYTDLLALRREEPALKPGGSVSHVEGAASWCSAIRLIPPQGDAYDTFRVQHAIWCVFNLAGETQEIPVPVEAAGAWQLRLSTDGQGYGGTGQLVPRIPAIELSRVDPEAPKRLFEPAAIPRAADRTVRLPAWSAAVYVRELPGAASSTASDSAAGSAS